MPSKARFAAGERDKWHRLINGRRVTYPELLPDMLDMDRLEGNGKVHLTSEHRLALTVGLSALVHDAYREQSAQTATEVKSQYRELQRAIYRAGKAATKLGNDASANLDEFLKTRLGFEYGLLETIGSILTFLLFEPGEISAKKKPDIVRDIVRMYLPIYESAGGKASKSVRGPFVASIEILNDALPEEFRALRSDLYPLGDRVKNAVTELLTYEP